MTSDSVTFEDADTDGDESLSESELQALTIAQLKAVAAELGYTITARKKAAIIAEILEQQEAAAADPDDDESDDQTETPGEDDQTGQEG